VEKCQSKSVHVQAVKSSTKMVMARGSSALSGDWALPRTRAQSFRFTGSGKLEPCKPHHCPCCLLWMNLSAHPSGSFSYPAYPLRVLHSPHVYQLADRNLYASYMKPQ
jgi:hypothetical protein